MYSFSYLEPVCCSMSVSNCCFLTCIQVSQEAGKVVWYSHHLENFPQFVVNHTVKRFSVVSEGEVDVFSGILLFFLWSSGYWRFHLAPLSFLNPAWTSGSSHSVHILLKPSLEIFEHYFASIWDKCNCVVVWTFLAFPFFVISMKTDLSSPVATAKFSKFADILSAAL